jgi:hypothetical protein
MEKEKRKIGRWETKRRKQELRTLKKLLVCTPNIITLIVNKGKPIYCYIAELNDFSFSRPGCAIHEICKRNVETPPGCINPPPLQAGVVTGRVRTGKQKVGTSSWGRAALKPNHTIRESWSNTASCLA